MPEWIKDNQTPTLFVFACGNYKMINGMTMNNEAYTAYPSESEVLLYEGCGINVLSIDYGVKIENNEGEIGMYNGQQRTVVHRFHP